MALRPGFCDTAQALTTTTPSLLLPIAFHRPHHAPSASTWVERALRSDHWRGDGPFTAHAASLLSPLVGNGAVLLTTSCTQALELAALVLEVGPDDEVIVPSWTFVTTASAFALRGARLVFADCLPGTLCVDPADVARKRTSRTRAIVVVHYAGVACDMPALVALCDERCVLIEDNAHGLGGALHERPLGGWGAMATLSFHDTKNVSCGEGGALIVNDERFLERAGMLREKGVDRARFLRGEVSFYSWIDIGTSALLAEPLAALLCSQLEVFGSMQQRRATLWRRYQEALSSWAARLGVQQPHVPQGATNAAHLYWLRLPSPASRVLLTAHLAARCVDARFHYHDLSSSLAGLKVGGHRRECPTSEAVANDLLRLPLYPDLSDEQQQRVIDAVTAWR